MEHNKRPTPSRQTPGCQRAGGGGLGALAVGLGSFKSPQLGESIEKQVFEEPHERAEQQYEQQTAEQQRQQAAERQSGLDVTEKGLKEGSDLEVRRCRGKRPEKAAFLSNFDLQ